MYYIVFFENNGAIKGFATFFSREVFIKSAREARVARFAQRILLNFRTPPRAPPFGGPGTIPFSAKWL